MSEHVARIWFVVLLVMVLAWFVLLARLFRYLQEHHPATYRAIGSPTLLLNRSPRHDWLFMKFLFNARWSELGDPVLAGSCRFMRAFLVIYLVLLLCLVLSGGLFRL